MTQWSRAPIGGGLPEWRSGQAAHLTAVQSHGVDVDVAALRPFEIAICSPWEKDAEATCVRVRGSVVWVRPVPSGWIRKYWA